MTLAIYFIIGVFLVRINYNIFLIICKFIYKLADNKVVHPRPVAATLSVGFTLTAALGVLGDYPVLPIFTIIPNTLLAMWESGTEVTNFLFLCIAVYCIYDMLCIISGSER